MNRTSPWMRFSALTLISLAAATLFPRHSDPALKPLEPAPDPKELQLMEELVTWMTGSTGDGFRAVGEDDLIAAIRERPQSFDLFRRYNGSEAKRTLLKQLPYGDAIGRAARRYELDSLLLAAVVESESNFNPEVVSPRGAVGLAQLMPRTGRQLTAGNLFDPEVNLDAGARYLSGLLDRFGGDLPLALAAYNAGPGNVRRYGGLPPFRETQSYVEKVLEIYVQHHQEVWSRNPETRGLVTF